MATLTGTTKDNIDIEIDDTELAEYIQENFEPDDIFNYEVLSVWANDNGYIEEEG